MRRSRPARPAFATLTAMVTLATAAVAVAIVAALMATELRRTRGQDSGAQLRQLLLAGAASAQGHLNQSGAANRTELTVALPAVLIERGASLRITLEPMDNVERCQARITARFADRLAEQSVVFARDAGRWQMREARLVRANVPAPPATRPAVAAPPAEAP